MPLLQRLFGRPNRRRSVDPLYRAIVDIGRDPAWYREGRVPDTVDGRFDVIAAVIALVLLRLEDEGEAGRVPSVLLTEIFIDDMDASLRQIGIGDYVVGKHVGRLLGALGGRLTALRAARASAGGFAEAVRRNIYHDAPPSEAEVEWTAARLQRLSRALATQGLEALLAGEVPKP